MKVDRSASDTKAQARSYQPFNLDGYGNMQIGSEIIHKSVRTFQKPARKTMGSRVKDLQAMFGGGGPSKTSSSKTALINIINTSMLSQPHAPTTNIKQPKTF